VLQDVGDDDAAAFGADLGALAAATECYFDATSPLSCYSGDGRAHFWRDLSMLMPGLLYYVLALDAGERAPVFAVFHALQRRDAAAHTTADLLRNRCRGPVLHALLSAPPDVYERLRAFLVRVANADAGEFFPALSAPAHAFVDAGRALKHEGRRAAAACACHHGRTTRPPPARRLGRKASVATLAAASTVDKFDQLEAAALRRVPPAPADDVVAALAPLDSDSALDLEAPIAAVDRQPEVCCALTF